QAEDGIRDFHVTGVQTCALPISPASGNGGTAPRRPAKVAVAVAAKPQAPTPRSKYKVVQYKTDSTTGRPILPKGYRPDPEEEYIDRKSVVRERVEKWVVAADLKK